MIYQIVINITDSIDSHSNKSINDVFKKYTENNLTPKDAILLKKILCYSILLFKLETDVINLDFVGKTICIHSELIDDIIVGHKLDIQSIENINSDENYVMPHFSGGLCNRLFQIFTIFNFANKNGKKVVINTSLNNQSINPHSDQDYTKTIFKNIQKKSFNKIDIIYEKEQFIYHDLVKFDHNVSYDGYYQHENYISDIICDFYNITSLKQPASFYNNTIFIHIRLGDYRRSSLHNIRLIENNYYKNAYSYFADMDVKNIRVYSDDLKTAQTLLGFLPKNVEYCDYDEINSLIDMSICEFGGICSNSSFSWWGAYLNINFNNCPDKKFIFPTKWLNTTGKCDVQFRGSILI
jgi:hypothetical protein